MKIGTDTQIGLLGGALLALVLAAPAWADDSAMADGKDDVAKLYLGQLEITGQQHIIDTLLAIKVALKEPLSDAPDKANTVVCRIDKAMDEAKEYLDCATNTDYSGQRASTAVHMLTHKLGTVEAYDGEATQMDFDSLVQRQPNHRLHVPVNGGALLALLDNLPDDAKVVSDSQ
ncbi:MAG: hypothetical protein ACM3ZT_04935 [Bacillota bacterium]